QTLNEREKERARLMIHLSLSASCQAAVASTCAQQRGTCNKNTPVTWKRNLWRKLYTSGS
ncbi:hypothetical protein KUCAC02_021354, partial [Chaenocephalus aceratus]